MSLKDYKDAAYILKETRTYVSFLLNGLNNDPTKMYPSNISDRFAIISKLWKSE